MQKRLIWSNETKLPEMSQQPIRENKTILSKTCLLSVFELLTYQNAKTRPKKPFMEKQNNISCIFLVFLSVLGNKTPKCREIPLYGENKRY